VSYSPKTLLVNFRFVLKVYFNMITGLPAYKPPVAEPVRCYCRSFFFVFTGERDSQAREAERKAQEMGAVFVDARLTPFYQCVWAGVELSTLPTQ
jgi:hypothetical protein